MLVTLMFILGACDAIGPSRGDWLSNAPSQAGDREAYNCSITAHLAGFC
jgi:hypothetical protein